MKKRAIYYVFAGLLALGMMASCDDETPNQGGGTEKPEGGSGEGEETGFPIEKELVGTYKSSLDISLEGIPTPVANGLVKQILISKSSDTAVKMELKDFALDFNRMEISLGTLAIDGCALESTETAGVYSFSGSATLTGLDVFGNGSSVDCKVTVTEGTLGNSQLSMSLDVEVAGLPMKVVVNCTGTKLSGSEKTEAKMLTFQFETAVAEANGVVTSVSEINEEEGTIAFTVKADATDEDLKVLQPTITVSEGATVSPASGSTVDFSSGSVKFTVTAESGASKVYTASYTKDNGGGETVDPTVYDFENWVKDSHKPMVGSKKEFDVPEYWKTSNAGIVEMGLIASFAGNPEMSVLKSEGELSGTFSALVQTQNTKGFSFGNLKVPTITAGSLYLGTWKTNASNTLNSTKFGQQFDASLGKPVQVKVRYKYESGEDFYTCTDGKVDKGTVDASKGKYADEFSIKVSLYKTDNYDETNYSDYLTGEAGEMSFYDSSRVIGKGKLEQGGTQGAWKEETITLTYTENFDPNQKYRFAIVCSSSKDGDKFWGAPGSKLWVDDIEVIYE